MAEFVEVMRQEELPPGKGTTVTVGGKDVALFNVDGTIHSSEATRTLFVCEP
jgi:nitrite reductase/ring-hydroxylating ferredoxin subunit